MNPIFSGRIAYAFLLIFFVSTDSNLVYAGEKDCLSDKWKDHPICTVTDPGPDPDDPCANFAAPDFVFWRDARTKGKNRMAQVAVYAADSTSSCEAKLLDIPLPEGPINDLNLAFSSVVDSGVFFGRVVWARQINGWATSVWMYDFSVEQGAVVEKREPTMIMQVEGERWDQDISFLDLSPDAQTLVYSLRERGDPNDTVSIRLIDVANCLDLCKFDAGTSIYSLVDTVEPNVDLRTPVWGPLGYRIYFVERRGWPSYTYDVNAIDVSGENLVTLVTWISGDDPDTATHVREVSSGIGYGWPEEKEYLTVSIGDFSTHGCRFIYSLDVDACEPECVLTPMFAGIWPSWNRDGQIIHTHQGLTMRENCRTDTVGSWDGANLETILKGYEPEAAGG